eukprot:scaffold602_cov298-Pinguiococcus_pyrenoidosus.AAC.19
MVGVGFLLRLGTGRTELSKDRIQPLVHLVQGAFVACERPKGSLPPNWRHYLGVIGRRSITLRSPTESEYSRSPTTNPRSRATSESSTREAGREANLSRKCGFLALRLHRLCPPMPSTALCRHLGVPALCSRPQPPSPALRAHRKALTLSKGPKPPQCGAVRTSNPKRSSVPFRNLSEEEFRLWARQIPKISAEAGTDAQNAAMPCDRRTPQGPAWHPDPLTPASAKTLAWTSWAS